MTRLVALSALFGLALTGAAAASTTAEVSILPENGTCPSGFQMQKSSAGGDECVQSVNSGSTAGTISMASFSKGGDDDSDHGRSEHSNDNSGHEDHGHSDHDSDSD